MSSSNVRAASIALENDRAQDDNPSMLHKSVRCMSIRRSITSAYQLCTVGRHFNSGLEKAARLRPTRESSVFLKDYTQNRRSCWIGLDHPYDIEYNFTSQFSVSFWGWFICGGTYHFSRVDRPVGINSKEEKRLFFNEMWAHNPHTKERSRERISVSTF